MIDLAAVELLEIRRSTLNLLSEGTATAGQIQALFEERFPAALIPDDLNPAQRRNWLNELRACQRSKRLSSVFTLQPTLPFTGGVSESYNQK